ncbi:hypothetical protein LSTR_LSTR015386 [Laodelphax striatellus]|uniref:VM domain-containing protein n=1 Tax=Laodelphax striatellus TaxID=195883 RepID=A0A482WNU1_LAOST|nr:hypothetical protein LSTR_LSTR015386 [Laodelphax striatellus]
MMNVDPTPLLLLLIISLRVSTSPLQDTRSAKNYLLDEDELGRKHHHDTPRPKPVHSIAPPHGAHNLPSPNFMVSSGYDHHEHLPTHMIDELHPRPSGYHDRPSGYHERPSSYHERPSSYHERPPHTVLHERPSLVHSHFSSVLAPMVRNIVSNVLMNIAHGVSSGIVTGLAAGRPPPPYYHDAYPSPYRYPPYLDAHKSAEGANYPYDAVKTEMDYRNDPSFILSQPLSEQDNHKDSPYGSLVVISIIATFLSSIECAPSLETPKSESSSNLVEEPSSEAKTVVEPENATTTDRVREAKSDIDVDLDELANKNVDADIVSNNIHVMKHTIPLTFVVFCSLAFAQEVTEEPKESSSEEGEGRILGLGHLIRGGHALADAVVGGVVHGSNYAGTRLQQNLFGGLFSPPAPPLSPFQSPFYSPYYAPNFTPNYAPGFIAPNYAPPGFVRALGPAALHRPGHPGSYQPQFHRQDDDLYPLNFDGNEFPLHRSQDDYYIH